MEIAQFVKLIGWEMGQWLAEGRIKAREHIVAGLETFPETLLMLFDGRNQGKLIIKV